MTLRGRPHISLSVAVCLVPLFFAGCKCGEPENKSLAVLTEMNGAVERDFAAHLGAWRPARIGESFSVGDGVRAKSKSNAVLRLSEGSFVRLVERTEIRFLMSMEQGDKTAAFDVESGEAEIVVGGGQMKFDTGVGLAVVKPGSRFKVRKVKGGLDMRVGIGQASFYPAGTHGVAKTDLRKGEGIEVAIGGAILERFDENTDGKNRAPAAESKKTVSREEPDAGTSAEQAKGMETKTAASAEALEKTIFSGDENGPRYADFFASAGESFSVYTAEPPVVLELRFSSKCRYGAAVRLSSAKGRVKGRLSANLLLSHGRNAYRVYCLKEDGTEETKISASGKISVIRSTGLAPLPRTAPPSVVDADGRLYNISYQNQLPVITFRWPMAPKASKYVLHFESGREIKTSKPEHTFASGALKEGTHRFSYSVDGPEGRTSKTTAITLRFDTDTPQTSLKEPVEGSFGPGDTVRVEGLAAQGWEPSVIGAEVFSDKQYRFSGEFTFSGQYRSVALRLRHPGRGVHYYLRRSGSRADLSGGGIDGNR